jgi:pyruvate dehydrogenase E2 component (dihydrolipoamide acetyltransferase)
MPQLGETVTEGTITKWHKKVGDSVAEDEVLFEVSTDKVDSEVPSPVNGTVTEILVAEGETVSVGTKLAAIGQAGEAGPAGGYGATAAVAEAAARDGGSQVAEEPEPAVAAEVGAPVGGAGDVASGATTGGQTTGGQTTGGQTTGGRTIGGQSGAGGGAPVDREADREAGEAVGGGRVPAGQGARASAKPPVGAPPRPGSRPADQRPPSVPAQGGPSKLLSPVVRRLIAEHGLDPAGITGSGAGGRITRDDVLAAIERQGPNGAGGTAEELAPAGPGAAPAAARGRAVEPGAGTAGVATRSVVPAGPVPVAGEGDTIVPFTNIRRRTAEHMVRSKHTSAHTMVAVEVDYSAVERARLAEREHFKATEGFSLTYLPFISRAVVDALGEWPYLNSSVGEDELIVHGEVNLGIAVDLDFEGLLVPVVHRAEDKRLVALAREISGLASRARSKRLTMDDISGGTFTITNAGAFGTLITVPVINQPQVAILSSDGVRKKPVVIELPDGSDGIAVHPVGNLVLSWDHRAVDGAYAAAFMARAREVLETRDWAAEL